MRPASLLVLLGACDGDPCFRGDRDLCLGTIVVDAATNQPAFTIEGLGRVTPTRLSVDLWLEGDICGSGMSAAAWEIEGLEADALPVRYAELPVGAREAWEPQLLEKGREYTVSFSVDHGPLTDNGTVPWIGMFVAGDPDSGQTMEEACP